MKYICKKCLQLKTAAEFYKSKGNANGLHSWCRKCSREYNTSDKMKTSQIEYRARNNKKTSKIYVIETGGTTVGGYKFVVLDHKKITGKQIDKFNDKNYIKQESEKIFDFLTDNVPSKVFQELTRIMIDYDARKELLGLDMNKFNTINEDLINLQKELK